MADNPPGAWYQLMGSVTRAMLLSYQASSGPAFIPEMATATIEPASASGEVWERVFSLESDPVSGGVHSKVFVNHEASRAIVAYRGSCLDDSVEQCMLDLCYLFKVRGMGDASAESYRVNDTYCETFSSKLDYVAQADAVVRNVQAQLPGYHVLATGHSLGGHLAIVTAAQQPGVVQAVTFAPTPFHYALLHEAGLTEAQAEALPSEDLIATCDRYDCGYNSLFLTHPRQGATTCLYLGVPEPLQCDMLPMVPYGFEPWRKEWTEFMDGAVKDNLLSFSCKSAAHDEQRYEDIVFEKQADGSPKNLPTCRDGFSW